jgi:hypothetical protein
MVRVASLRALPDTRGECADGIRPCPLVSCRFHLLLNVTSDGRMYSQKDFDEDDADSISDAIRDLEESCALDVADRGGHLPLEEVGHLLGTVSWRSLVDTEREAMAKMAVLMADDHPDDPYIRLMAVQELKKR